MKFSRAFYFRECSVKRELKPHENFNYRYNALTINFLQ
jgi:hypothetical protein